MSVAVWYGERDRHIAERESEKNTHGHLYIYRAHADITYTARNTVYVYIYIIYDCTVFIFPLDPVSVESTTRFCRTFFFP